MYTIYVLVTQEAPLTASKAWCGACPKSILALLEILGPQQSLVEWCRFSPGSLGMSRQTNIGKNKSKWDVSQNRIASETWVILFILHGITHHTPLSWHGYVVGRCRTKNHQSKAAEIASPLIHDSWLICFRTIYSNTTMWYQLITLMVDCFARIG